MLVFYEFFVNSWRDGYIKIKLKIIQKLEQVIFDFQLT